MTVTGVSVMGLWKRLVNGLKALGGLLLPVFARAGDLRALSPAAWWGAHLALLAAVLIGLYLVNWWLDLGRLLVPPHPALRDFWLPVLFLLVYLLSWLGWWMWRQLGPAQESPMFPDLDRAWDEAVHALDQAGIDLTEAPLFLILGRPRGGEEALFQGAKLGLQVVGAPHRADAPMRVYASREGVYVACPGTSLLSRQSALLAEKPGGPAAAGGDGITPFPSAPGRSAFSTLTAVGGPEAAKAMESIIARAREQGRGVTDLLEDERHALGVLLAGQPPEPAGGSQATARARAALLRDRAEIDLQTARLTHLCRLIARDRSPYCPINGVLLLLPLAATDGDEEASQVGQLCQRDLATIRETTNIRCPVFALVCELETLPGFPEMVERLPESQRDRRMGQRFPLVPDLEPAKIPTMIDSGVVWIGRILFPSLVDRLWAIEAPGRLPTDEAVRGNIQLYDLLRQIRDRMTRLARLLTRACVPENERPAMFGGCYLAGTGSHPAREQAFIPGTFRRLTESQDFVSWTPEALRDDQAYNRWSFYGYTAVAATVVAGLASLILLLR